MMRSLMSKPLSIYFDAFRTEVFHCPVPNCQIIFLSFAIRCICPYWLYNVYIMQAQYQPLISKLFSFCFDAFRTEVFHPPFPNCQTMFLTFAMRCICPYLLYILCLILNHSPYTSMLLEQRFSIYHFPITRIFLSFAIRIRVFAYIYCIYYVQY